MIKQINYEQGHGFTSWSKKRFSLKTAALIFLCHIGIAIFFWTKGAMYEPFYAAAGLMVVASVPYLYAIVIKKDFIAYEAIYFYLAGFIMNYTAVFYLPANEISYDPEILKSVMQISIIGVASFIIGYEVVFGKYIAKALPLKNFIYPEDKLPRLPLKLYIIGWAVRCFFIFHLAENKYAGWQIMDVFMNVSIYTGLMVDFYLAFSKWPLNPGIARKKKMYLARAVIFLVGELARIFLAGFSGGQLVPLALILVTYMKVKKKIPIIPIITVIVFFALIVIPFTKTFRAKSWQGAGFQESVNYAFDELSDKDKMYKRRVNSVTRISNPIDVTIACLKKIEEGRPVKTYKSLSDYFSQFIPRFIWPDRPTIDFNKIGKDLELLGPDDYNTSCGLTGLASFLSNGGTVGVIIGMFFVGLLMRIWWEWLIIRSGENLLSFLVYFLMIITWATGEIDYLISFNATMAYIVYLYCLFGLINKKRRGSTLQNA